MTTFCCGNVWIHGSGITPESNLSYLNRFGGFLLGSFSGFCRLRIADRWSVLCVVSVSAPVYGVSLADNGAHSTVLSTSHCRAPMRVACSHRNEEYVAKRFLWCTCCLVPYGFHKLDRVLKSLHMSCFPVRLPSFQGKHQLAHVEQALG